VPSTNAKRAATEALRRHALASLKRDRPVLPVNQEPQAPAPVVSRTVPAPAPPIVSTSNPSNPSDLPVQNPDGSWAYRGETFARGHDAWASFPGRRKPVQPERKDWRSEPTGLPGLLWPLNPRKFRPANIRLGGLG
jgi:hypothetical protein